MAGYDSMAALKTRQKMEARAAVEEDLFARVPLSKDEAKRLKQQRRAGLSGAGGRRWLAGVNYWLACCCPHGQLYAEAHTERGLPHRLC